MIKKNVNTLEMFILSNSVISTVTLTPAEVNRNFIRVCKVDKEWLRSAIRRHFGKNIEKIETYCLISMKTKKYYSDTDGTYHVVKKKERSPYIDSELINN